MTASWNYEHGHLSAEPAGMCAKLISGHLQDLLQTGPSRDKWHAIRERKGRARCYDMERPHGRYLSTTTDLDLACCAVDTCACTIAA